MTNKAQQQRYRNSISQTSLQAATVALALAAVLVPGVKATTQAQTFTTLLSFDSTDGYQPGDLVQATYGDLTGQRLLAEPMRVGRLSKSPRVAR